MSDQMGKKPKKKVNIFAIIVLIICLCGLGYCGYKLYKIWLDYHTSDTEYEQLIEDFVTLPETIINKGDGTEEDSAYPYLEIDWEALKNKNPDIIGWIRIPDTSINYPIVQGDTNEDYIHTTVEGTYSSAGSVFLNCDNASDLSDYVSVIYGHNMGNGSMFTALRYYLEEEYLNEHKCVEIYTPQWAKVYTPKFIYTSHYTDDAYSPWIKEFTTYKSYLEARNKQSRFKLDYSDTENSIVLSTCYGKSGTEYRMIVIVQPSKDYETIYY